MLIFNILKNTDNWGGPEGWWGKLGLSMHPALYGVAVITILLLPVGIVAGWISFSILIGPVQATKWAKDFLLDIPEIISELKGKR